MKLIGKEIVNTQRQLEIDLLRGFTLIILIICHVGLYLGDNNDPILFTISDIIGSETGAPIFMTLMGICMSYSRNKKPINMFKRGIGLLLIGILISIIRSLIPYILFGNIDEWASFDAFWVVDIMELSGLSFILFGLFKKLKIPNLGIFIISLVFVGLGQIYLAHPFTIESSYLTTF